MGTMAGLLTFGFWIAVIALSLPLLALFGLLIGARRIFRWMRVGPALQSLCAKMRARALHRRLRRARNQTAFPTPTEFAFQFSATLAAAEPHLNSSVREAFVACARALYESEAFGADLPMPQVANALDAARYHDSVLQAIAKLTDPETLPSFSELLLRGFRTMCVQVPPIAFRGTGGSEVPSSDLTVRLLEAMSKTAEAIENMTATFCGSMAIEANLFAGLRDRLARNRYGASGLAYSPLPFTPPRLVPPTKHKGTPEEIVKAYLGDTPLEALFAVDLPFEPPLATRFEHQWIVAGSGHGKSQTLQYLIGALDLPAVARNERSVVVIDSQADLIRNIAGLKLFAPGEPLHGKLVVIDPSDIEFPVALNLFDAGQDRLKHYSMLDRERLVNSILELYDFVLGSLLSAELTQKQAVIFRFLTRLMLHIPNATLHTFRELMEPNGFEKYRPYVANLEGTARSFFETEFESREFADTKRQVLRRLWGILENRTFERMFSHPRNKLNMFAEMNAGKVILINTAKDLLKETGSQIFGRFFIALIAQAAQERAAIPADQRKPTLVYVDECGETLDQNVATILETARKQAVALVLAQQHLSQGAPKLIDTLMSNTSIKFIGGVSDKDARAFAHQMRCTPEFILDQKKGHFAAFVRNQTSSAVSLHVPFGLLERLPRMSPAEEATVRDQMRQKYAVPLTRAGRNVGSGAPPPAAQDADPASPAEW